MCKMDTFVYLIFLLIFYEILLLHTSLEYVNVSENKTAYSLDYYDRRIPDNKAVDGDLRQTVPHVTMTIMHHTVSWYVDLGASRNIHSVKIYYRDEGPERVDYYRRRFAGFSLFISDVTNTMIGYACPVNSSYPPLIYNISCQYSGRYVKLYNYRGNYTAILELAEVQVFGCLSPMKYGINCKKSCPSTCKNSHCYVASGHCFLCPVGKEGNYCDIDSLLLSQERPAYLSGQLYVYTRAAKAVDGQLSQLWPNLAATKVSTSVDWYVDLGASRNIYRIKIYYRDQGPKSADIYRRRFAGFSLYISDDTNYKSGYNCAVNSSYPLLIYDVNCQKPGRYVRLYNYRSNGSAILELAEVQVFGCMNTTIYGVNCEKNCPWSCKYNHCHPATGFCFSCPPGYTGNKCDMLCSDESYGDVCLNSCSGKCKNGLMCNITNGHCDNGCIDGFKGEKCDRECDSNEYGPGCIYPCGKCKNEVTCDKVNGKCPSGCKPGYVTQLCNEKEHSSQLWMGIGIGAGVVLIIILLCSLGFLLIRTLRNYIKSATEEHSNTPGSRMETVNAENDNADSGTGYINLVINENETSQGTNSAYNPGYQELSDISRDAVYNNVISA